LSAQPSFFIASGCPIATTTLYRCTHLQEQLEFLGYTAKVAEWFDDAKIGAEEALTYDVIFLYRLAMSAPLERLISVARERGKPVIFDTDDLIFEPKLVGWHRAVKKLSLSDQEQHLDGVRRYLATLLVSDAVTVATPTLAELVRQRGKTVFVHRNALGNEMLKLANSLYERRRNQKDRERVVIGYGSGTPTHDEDFEEAAIALVHILSRFPQVELWLAGPLALPQSLETLEKRIRRFPLTDWRGWFELMSEMDIVLAPLEQDNIFCRAKSEIKFVEAGALGVAVVASKTEPFKDAIAHGDNGLLAADEEEWRQALAQMIEQPERRWMMGEQARRRVLQRYSLRARAAELAAILPRLLSWMKAR